MCAAMERGSVARSSSVEVRMVIQIGGVHSHPVWQCAHFDVCESKRPRAVIACEVDGRITCVQRSVAQRSSARTRRRQQREHSHNSRHTSRHRGTVVR